MLVAGFPSGGCPEAATALSRSGSDRGGAGRRDIHSVGGDGSLQEAGARGLALADGQETLTGTGNGTVAVVTGAGTLLNDTSHDGGDEGQDNGSLHLD